MSAADGEDLRRRLTEAVYRTPPSPTQSDLNMVSLKLVTASQGFDLRAEVASRIRTIFPCRVVTGNLRTPKVLFVVMEDAVAVLGPVGWSGFLDPAPHPLDVFLPWSQVSTIGFQFPEPWGPLSAPSSKKFIAGSGEHQIVVNAATGKTVRLVPDGEMKGDLSSIARHTAAILDGFEQEQSKDPKVVQTAHLRGIMRYLPDLQNSSGDTRVVLSCSLVQQTDLLDGYLVVAGETFGFFDFHDCLVDDLDEGTPILYPVNAITGCSVMKPSQFFVAPRVAVEVQPIPWGDEIISVIVEIDGVELPFALSAGKDLDAADRHAIEQDFGKFLGLIDRGILQ